MDRDRGARRFDDGEVVRYGAGESWRPTPRGGNDNRDRDRDRDRDRSPPRRARSPPPRDDRDRSRPPRSPRPRSPPQMASDSYVPGGRYVPRRRSNSRGGPPGGLGDRYRRDRSRESPRRRDRTRSPPPPPVQARRSPLRRSPSRGPRRGTPRRFSPGRGDRFERPRSPPRRDWGDRDRDVDRRDKDEVRDRDRDWRDRDRSRDRDIDRRDDRRDDRRRSRSPMNRDRRERSPAERGTPPVRGGSWRPSRSPSRRGGDRFQSFRRSPPRDSNLSSAMNSEPASNRASPRPGPMRGGRSPMPSRDQSPAGVSRPGVAREQSRSNLSDHPKSPPRGPAALRAPPTGPAASRSFSNSSQPPTTGGHRDITSPTLPPSGPRGYVPPTRGSYSSRGGRGGWNPPARHTGPSPGPSGPTGPSSIPTGPRAASNAPASSTSTQSRPFNPPTGPSAGGSSIPRQSIAQSLLATMPPIIPGGRLSPSWTPFALGVTKELAPHYLKLKEEEEKIREELYAKQDKLRKSMAEWRRLDRESKAWRIRSELSERSLIEMSGEGTGGAAF